MTDISREYAAALFTLARETGSRYGAELDTVEQIFAAEPAYTELLASPGIPLQQRTAALGQALGNAVLPPVLHFLQLLCEHGYIRQLPACIREYRALEQAADRQTTARVVSAAALTPEQQQALQQRLEKLSGRTVLLQCETDPALLGGVTVYMDGRVLDGSLRHRLHDMKEVMEQ